MQTDVSFDAPRDESECPDTCPARFRFAHKHCASFGCVLDGEGGSGDDGRGIAGYVDAKGSAAEICVDCGREICPGCARYSGDDCPRCFDCDHVVFLHVLDEAAMSMDLHDAARDVADSLRRMRDETDVVRLQELQKPLRDLRRLLEIYDRELPMRIQRADATPLPGVAA